MFAMKGRPRWHPAIVHLSSAAEAGEWAQMNSSAEKLAAAFWPGPLTLILPALPKARAAAGKEGAVALRMPSHPLARELLLRAGVGAAAPSANRFGKVSPTCAAHVAADFAEEESLYVLDGGDCEAGIESSIVSCLDNRPALLRPGAVGEKQIAAVVGALSSPPPVSSPGKLPSHYATKTPLFLAAAEDIAHVGDNKTAVLSQTRPPQTPPALWRCAEKKPAPLRAPPLRAIARVGYNTSVAHCRRSPANNRRMDGIARPPRPRQRRKNSDRRRFSFSRIMPQQIPPSPAGRGYARP